MLERSTREQRGGNTRYTDAFLRLNSETELTEDFEWRLVNSSSALLEPELMEKTALPYEQWPLQVKAHAFADPVVVYTFAERVVGSISWLKSHGVRFVSEYPAMPTRSVPRMAPVGGGLEIVERLTAAAENAGVRFHYQTTGRSLKIGQMGDILGLTAWSPTEGVIDFTSKAVVLASGGFQGNPEMMTRYLGNSAYLLRPISRGGMFNKGEGIQMALDIGAAPAGQYDNFHAEPTDPRTSRTDPAIYSFSYGVLVNKAGKRFIDEASGLTDLIYEEVARNIWKQPDGQAWVIFDSQISALESFQHGVKSDLPPITAGSIPELASKTGISPEGLQQTLDKFNGAPRKGSFDPSGLDGLCTLDINPPKSNWAIAITGPEYMAYPLICSNVFTFGGLKVSPRAQVVNSDGYGIPGLYAAGEVVGLYYKDYPGSTSVLRGLVFGLIAGENAAQTLYR